jgi:catechol 2,3-dioxygenase-like lactoylglutathione lyase family enzyme
MHTSHRFTGAVPILRVNDLDASLDYYISKLGFKENWRWPGFASVGRDGVTIFLCEGKQGQPGTWMSVFMKDVMPLYEEYKASGARIIEPPMNFPWGHCEFLVTDLDGHMLRMSGNKTGPDSKGYENTLRARST